MESPSPASGGAQDMRVIDSGMSNESPFNPPTLSLSPEGGAGWGEGAPIRNA